MTFWKGIVVLGLLCSAYVLFVGPFSASEALAAIPAVLGGFGFAVLYGHHAERALVVRAPWSRLARRMVLTLARDTIQVGRALLHSLVNPLSGRIALQPFEPGDSAAEAVGRRAVVTLAASLAPNGYVLRVTEDKLVLHQLVREPVKSDRKWPL
jgi:hypothetical protein